MSDNIGKEFMRRTRYSEMGRIPPTAGYSTTSAGNQLPDGCIPGPPAGSGGSQFSRP